MIADSRMRYVAYALFALSGFAALVLEAVFLRQLAWLFGNSTAATALVLAAFMAGLALGAWAFGRMADRSSRPLFLFGALEVGTAVSSLGLVFLLGRGRELFLGPLRLLPAGPVERVAEFVLAFLLLMLPTVLMGGTLPALSRQLIGTLSGFAGSLGRLYAVNTWGAACGVFVAGFFLFERLGIVATAWVAIGIQAAVGASAMLLARSGTGFDVRPAVPPDRAAPAGVEASGPVVGAGARRACLIAAAAGGLAVLGYEVVWTRLLSLFMRSFSYSFSLMLALFLTGLCLGAALLAGLSRRIRDVPTTLGWLQVAMGLYVVLTLLWLPGHLSPVAGRSFAGFLAAAGLRAALVVLPPTILSGMVLPLAARGVAGDATRVGKDVGLIYGVNTLGAIGGSLLAGLVLLPWLGALHALAVLATVNAAAGAYVISRSPGRRVQAAVAGALALGCLLPLAAGPESFVRGFLSASSNSEAIGDLLFFEEGATTTVAVVRKRYGFHDPDAKSLITNGVAMSATTRPVWRYMALEGHLPAAMAPLGARALAVGVGTGITLGAVASNRSVASITAVELSEGVIHALGQFEHENGGAYRDPRVRLLREDGRHYLELAEELFDMITLEPPPPIVAGSVHLYSLDFYRLCRRRLSPSGVAAQWLPLHAQSLASARMTAATFVEAFPYVTLWLPSVRDAVLIGTAEPQQLSLDRLDAMFADQVTRANLERAYLETPEALLATLLLDRRGVSAWAGNPPATPLITDERPRMEFWRSQGGNMTDADIATLLAEPQAAWDFVDGLAADPKRLTRVQIENRALRLYAESVAGKNPAAGVEAVRLSTATEFFLFPYGCTARQMEYLRGEAGAGAGARGVEGHLARCSQLRGRVSTPE